VNHHPTDNMNIISPILKEEFQLKIFNLIFLIFLFFISFNLNKFSFKSVYNKNNISSEEGFLYLICTIVIQLKHIMFKNSNVI